MRTWCNASITDKNIAQKDTLCRFDILCPKFLLQVTSTLLANGLKAAGHKLAQIFAFLSLTTQWGTTTLRGESQLSAWPWPRKRISLIMPRRRSVELPGQMIRGIDSSTRPRSLVVACTVATIRYCTTTLPVNSRTLSTPTVPRTSSQRRLLLNLLLKVFFLAKRRSLLSVELLCWDGRCGAHRQKKNFQGPV